MTTQRCVLAGLMAGMLGLANGCFHVGPLDAEKDTSQDAAADSDADADTDSDTDGDADGDTDGDTDTGECYEGDYTITTTADAPSFMLDEFPAVSIPSFLKAGFSFARASRVESSLGPSSCEKTTISFLDGISTFTISSLNAPDFIARTAF